MDVYYDIEVFASGEIESGVVFYGCHSERRFFARSAKNDVRNPLNGCSQ